jgi:hypothetical protein
MGTLVHSVLQGCVELYEAWHDLAPGQGYDQRAAHWREKLQAWQASTRPATP